MKEAQYTQFFSMWLAKQRSTGGISI